MYRYGENLYQAEDTTDTNDRTHQCDECGRRFATRDQTTCHKRNVHGPFVYCKYYPFKIRKTRSYLLFRHTNRVHGVELQRDGTQAPEVSKYRTVTVTRPTPVLAVTKPAAVTKPGANTYPRAVTKPGAISTVTAPPTLLPATLPLATTPVPVPPILDTLDILNTPQLLTLPAQDWKSPGFNVALMGGLDYSPVKDLGLDIPLDYVLKPGDGQQQTTTSTTEIQAAITTTSTETQTSTSPTTTSTTQTEEQPPRECDEVRPHHMSSNPAYFFCGAPSHYMEGHTASILRATRTSATQHKENYRRRWVPHGYICIQKVETVTFPDGRTYTLQDTWVRQPQVIRTFTTSTQTHSTLQMDTTVEEQPLDLRVRKEE